MSARCNSHRIRGTAKTIFALPTALTAALLLAAAQPAAAQPGWVLSHQKISATEGGFTGILNDGDGFGASAASLGDLDGDGVGDLAVGTPGDDDGGENRGAVWVLFLNTDGTVNWYQKISDTEGNFDGILHDQDLFGCSLASLGDLDGDGVGELAVGAERDGDGGFWRGAVWVLFLNTNGTVKSHQKISSTQGNFDGILDDRDWFGASVAALGDHDGDGVGDLAVGAPLDDDGVGAGAVWVLFLNTDGTVKDHQKISDTQGNFDGILDDNDLFGCSLAAMGDLDGDGVGELAVGAKYDVDGGGSCHGAVWVLFLNTNGTVKDHQKISDTQGGFTGILNSWDDFGTSVAALGDLDGDGVTDLAVGAREYYGEYGGEHNRGAVWVLFLNTDGTVKDLQKINDYYGGFTGILDDDDRFGSSLAALGDLDGDGEGDLAVGAPGDDDGGTGRGAVWVLFPDECMWLGGDCNDNGVPDACDIAVGTSEDYDLNGVPDECEDCNDNGIPDACDVDCATGNCASHPLGCGESPDCNANGVPDECDPDCNENGIPDDCDVADGTSPDCNGNGVPDECDARVTFEAGTAIAGETPVRVALSKTYSDPVVVCSVNYTNNTVPIVPRVSNVTSSGFDVRLQNPSNDAVTTELVSYLVMESGAWIIGSFKCEARTYTSTVTDKQGSWLGEAQSYLQEYTAPVVIGQVMSENDPDWSVFWCRDDAPEYCDRNPPSPAALRTGKMVGEDTDTDRVPETVGFIVFEGAHGNIGGVEFEAWVGPDSICGVGDNPPYSYTFDTPFAEAPSVALTTVAGMDGGNGGWAQTHGPTPATHDQLFLSIDEDQVGDSERVHADEQVNYVVCAAPLVFTRDCNENGVPDECDIANGTSEDVNGNGIPDECECPGDLDGDGDVDLTDLATLLANYGTTGGATYEDGDLDADGDVDLTDLAGLLAVYGTTCP